MSSMTSDPAIMRALADFHRKCVSPPLNPTARAVLARLAAAGGELPGSQITTSERKSLGATCGRLRVVTWLPPSGAWDQQKDGSYNAWTCVLTPEGYAALEAGDD